LLTAADLKALARARLADANALLEASRFDGSAYLCGYSVELALKARACKTLKWTHFPETPGEFRRLETFKTHDLDILLRLSGREQYIEVHLFAEWTVVSQWSPESRYQPVGTVTATTTQGMISAAQKILADL
jgi:HEPN domain-containing protein